MDNLEWIDAYFQNSLSVEERTEFERKCVEEKDFAEEVAFYVSARKLLKDLPLSGNSWICRLAVMTSPLESSSAVANFKLLRR